MLNDQHGDVVQRLGRHGRAPEEPGQDEGVLGTAGGIFQRERDGRNPTFRRPKVGWMEEC